MKNMTKEGDWDWLLECNGHLIIMFYVISSRILSILPGLDEGEQNNNDPASIQGAFISFLQLRHLRIRDLQRTVSFL